MSNDLSKLIKKLESLESAKPLTECEYSDYKQADSVSMNVNMNGTGAKGIRELLDILKGLESSDDIMHSNIVDVNTNDFDIVSDEYENQVGSDAKVFPVSKMTQTGDDLHSKGKITKPSVAGGSNPLNVNENLTNRLNALYKEIKSR